jgi:HK97 gp10 family phage protein
VSDVTVVFNPSFPAEVIHSAELHRALLSVGDQVARRAAAATPKRTGRLAGSIDARLVGDEVHVAPHTRYADYVEFGTSEMRGRHYLEKGLG